MIKRKVLTLALVAAAAGATSAQTVTSPSVGPGSVRARKRINES